MDNPRQLKPDTSIQGMNEGKGTKLAQTNLLGFNCLGSYIQITFIQALKTIILTGRVKKYFLTTLMIRAQRKPRNLNIFQKQLKTQSISAVLCFNLFKPASLKSMLTHQLDVMPSDIFDPFWQC